METKQHNLEQPLDQRRNQKGKLENISREEKWKHNILKHIGCTKTVSKRVVYSNTHLD